MTKGPWATDNNCQYGKVLSFSNDAGLESLSPLVDYGLFV